MKLTKVKKAIEANTAAIAVLKAGVAKVTEKQPPKTPLYDGTDTVPAPPPVTRWNVLTSLSPDC